MDNKDFENLMLSALLAGLKPRKSLPIDSAWTGHIPFLFSLMTISRPKLFVELGVHNGASFFAACRASKELGGITRCVGVDHWRGDAHAGDFEEAVFLNFRKVLDESFPQIGEYFRGSFDSALTEFEEGSIDLLHIDGFHTYSAVKHDFESWLPKLSDQAIVLFHDVNVFREDFGVWRFWEEIKRDYGFRAMQLGNDHGLGVLFFGSSALEDCGGTDFIEILNEYWSYVQVLFSGLSEVEKMHLDASRQAERLFRLESEIRALENQIAQIQSSWTFKVLKSVRRLGSLGKDESQVHV